MTNVFDDEFAVEDFDLVADGFRPSGHDREGSIRQSEEARSGPIRASSIPRAITPPSPVSPLVPGPQTTPVRHSIRKSRGQDNPFASPEDDERTPSLQFEPDIAHRSVSSASSHNFASTSSPRFGAGPSHPYGMYPQGTIQRSVSIATQSTIRAPARQSSVHGGPQHPYTLYPQGVGADDDEEDDVAQDLAPVGFPGLSSSYARRVGPDGEEQDIIGEDGHTEQLPPYTRYPEDAPEKMPLLEVPAAPGALHSRAPVAGTDPTMALMHDPIQPRQTPQPQSMTDASSLRSGRSPSIANLERMTTNSERSLLSHKSWSEKSWKEKRKTRFCGCVPFWCILLALAVVVFIAAVLGGVIGGFLEGQAKGNPKGLSAASTSLYDASAIPTPATGPPTGTYQLSMSTPQETQAACLVQPSQQAAWSCDLAGQPAQAINVGIPPGGNETGAFIYYAADDDQICYGAQQAFMQTTFSPFMAVQDNDLPNNGPAFYFQQFYDKIVVVPEAALAAPPPPPGKAKRGGLLLDSAWLQQKQVAQAGEKPWFCVWNNTFMEGFIYVEQPIATSYAFTPTATPSANSTQGSTVSSPTPTSGQQGSSSNIITTTVTMPSSTATYTGPGQGFRSWITDQYKAEATGNAKSANNNGDDDDDGQGSHNKRQVLGQDAYTSMAVYPYVVKIEERRLQGNTITPYCQQYQILDDGGYNWVGDANGNPIIIELDEEDPGYSAYESANLAGSQRLKERGMVAGGCHCQWMSGQTT